LFTSVVYIENNGIQTVFFSLTQSSLTGEPILFRQYIDSTMRWYRLYVGTLFGNLTPTNHSLPRTGTSHFTTSHLAPRTLPLLSLTSKILLKIITILHRNAILQNAQTYTTAEVSITVHEV